MTLKNLVEKLGGDLRSLSKDYEAVSSLLIRMGLTDYEARAYLALVALGTSPARGVASIAQIPRTSAYKVMLGLERKGFARSVKGRPRAFVAVEPSEISKRFVGEVEDTFRRIEAARHMLSERGVPQLVYTIMGKERVLDKIGEMIERAETSFIMSSPSLSEIRRRLGKKFAAASTRGVELRIITSPFVKAPKYAIVTRREGLIATDVICDGKMALLAAPDLSACGYTDNEALAMHLEDFLNIMAETRR